MFSIVDYDTRYRPYNKSGEELKYADWVKLPVNPKGDGLQVLLEYRRGLEVFGVWCLLLEKATDEEPENRGKLVNHKGEAATIPEIAKGISLKGKEKLVAYALNVLTAMGWVHSDEQGEQSSAQAEQIPTKSSVIKSNKTKEYTEEFNQFWQRFKGRWDTEKGKYLKVGKYLAWEEWQKLTETEQKKAIAVADRTGGKFTPDACRWLKRKLFDDYNPKGVPK